MKRRPLQNTVWGVILVTVLGCSAQPAEKDEASEAPQEAQDASAVSSESFESGQVDARPLRRHLDVQQTIVHRQLYLESRRVREFQGDIFADPVAKILGLRTSTQVFEG